MHAEIQTIAFRQNGSEFRMQYDHSTPTPSFRFHHHSAYEFYIFLGGKIKICLENVLIDVVPNGMFVFPPNMLHGLLTLDEHGDYERMFFHVPPQFLEAMSTEGYSIPQTLEQAAADMHLFYTLQESHSRQLFALIQQAGALMGHEDDPLFELKRNMLMAQAVILMVEQIEQQKHIRPALPYQSHPFLSVALRYVNDHFTEELSLNDIAGHVNVSKYHLCHEFKRLTNNSILHYIVTKRLQYALNLLKKGVPPLDACFQSGFSTYSNFQKSFRVYYGISPRQYKSLSAGSSQNAAS